MMRDERRVTTRPQCASLKITAVPGSDRRCDEEETHRLRAADHEIAAGVIEIVTAQSRWLVDLGRRRFQRCGRRSDLDRALSFGRWTPLRRVGVEGRTLTVEPSSGPAVRSEITRQT
jgi:hypothetical protein